MREQPIYGCYDCGAPSDAGPYIDGVCTRCAEIRRRRGQPMPADGPSDTSKFNSEAEAVKISKPERFEDLLKLLFGVHYRQENPLDPDGEDCFVEYLMKVATEPSLISRAKNATDAAVIINPTPFQRFVMDGIENWFLNPARGRVVGATIAEQLATWVEQEAFRQAREWSQMTPSQRVERAEQERLDRFEAERNRRPKPLSAYSI